MRSASEQTFPTYRYQSTEIKRSQGKDKKYMTENYNCLIFWTWRKQ